MILPISSIMPCLHCTRWILGFAIVGVLIATNTYGQIVFSGVKVIEAQGDVRFKLKNSFTWKNLTAGIFLSTGDKIFVGENSFATIVYKSNGAILSMKPWSLLVIEDAPKLRTQFLLSVDTIKETKIKNGKNAEIANQLYQDIAAIGNQIAKDQADQKINGDKLGGFSAVQQRAIATARSQAKDQAYAAFLPQQVIKPINLAKKNSIFVEKFPTNVSVFFDPKFRNTLCEGVLFDRKTAIVHWQETQIGGFLRVTVQKPGSFVFKFTCNDSSIETVPIEMDFVSFSQELFFQRVRALNFSNLMVWQ